MILEPWPLPPLLLKFSWRLKKAGKMLNCCGSGRAARGGAGGSTAPAHAALLNSTVLWPVRWLSEQRGSPALRISCSVPSPSARPRRSLTNHIIVTWCAADTPPRALIVRDCARGPHVAALGLERNGSFPYPRNRCKIFIGMLRLIHPRRKVR